MTNVVINSPSGKIYIEADAVDQQAGAKPVSNKTVTELAQEDIANRFAEVLGFVRKSVGEHSPTSLEVELSLAISTEGNFIIVKGDATASLKLKAKWE